MLSTLPPPPAATCIAFYPQDNNIIATGRDNSTILIYNVRSSKVCFSPDMHQCNTNKTMASVISLVHAGYQHAEGSF